MNRPIDTPADARAAEQTDPICVACEMGKHEQCVGWCCECQCPRGASIPELQAENARLRAQLTLAEAALAEATTRIARQALTIHERQESWHEMAGRLHDANSKMAAAEAAREEATKRADKWQEDAEQLYQQGIKTENRLMAQLEAAAAETASLREFARHKDDCAVSVVAGLMETAHPSMDPVSVNCTCGLQALASRLKGE